MTEPRPVEAEVAVYVIACALASVAVAHVVARRAARRRWGGVPEDHTASENGLPRPVARLHYELLVARAELRAALGMPIGRTIELRGNELVLDAIESDDDPEVAASRARLAQLWERHADVLGHPHDPRWHLQGRLDWVHVGPFGRQVVHLQATLGHEPGRWIIVRAHRRTGRASFGCSAGGLPIGGTIRAGDAEHVMAVLAEALAAPALRPVLARCDGSEVRAAGGRRPLSIGGWRLTTLVPVAVHGWAPTEWRRATVPGSSCRGPDGLLP